MQSSSDIQQKIDEKIKTVVREYSQILGSMAAKLDYCEDKTKYFNDKKREMRNSTLAEVAALQVADINKGEFVGDVLNSHLEKSLKEITKKQSLDQATDSIRQFQEALYVINKEISILALKSLIATTDPLKLRGIAARLDQPELIKNSDLLTNFDQDKLDKVFSVFIGTSRTLSNITAPTNESPLKRRATVVKKPEPQQETSTSGGILSWFTGAKQAPQNETRHERVATVGNDVLGELNKTLQNKHTLSNPSIKPVQQKNTSIMPIPIVTQTIKLDQPTVVSTPVKKTETKVIETPVVEKQTSVEELRRKMSGINLAKPTSGTTNIPVSQNRSALHQPKNEQKVQTEVQTDKRPQMALSQEQLNKARSNIKPGL